jgi:hypothetical protein
MASAALIMSHHMKVRIILQGNSVKSCVNPCCLADFPLNNAHQYHQFPPCPAELATVVYVDGKNIEALVVADSSWYLMAMNPATSNEC